MPALKIDYQLTTTMNNKLVVWNKVRKRQKVSKPINALFELSMERGLTVPWRVVKGGAPRPVQKKRRGAAVNATTIQLIVLVGIYKYINRNMLANILSFFNNNSCVSLLILKSSLTFLFCNIFH